MGVGLENGVGAFYAVRPHIFIDVHQLISIDQMLHYVTIYINHSFLPCYTMAH
jgi:hypothetical protein